MCNYDKVLLMIKYYSRLFKYYVFWYDDDIIIFLFDIDLDGMGFFLKVYLIGRKVYCWIVCERLLFVVFLGNSFL